MSAEVVRICRYPVKGLSAEDLPGADLDAGKAIPHDRRFALARPGTEFDPANPEWMPKTRFLMLMRDEELAQLRSRFDAQWLPHHRSRRPDGPSCEDHGPRRKGGVGRFLCHVHAQYHRRKTPRGGSAGAHLCGRRTAATRRDRPVRLDCKP